MHGESFWNKDNTINIIITIIISVVVCDWSHRGFDSDQLRPSVLSIPGPVRRPGHNSTSWFAIILVMIAIIMIMVIREEDSYSSNPPSFPSPSGDESRKRLNVHFPEVRFSPRWDFPQGETLRPLLVLPDQLTFDQVVYSIVLGRLWQNHNDAFSSWWPLMISTQPGRYLPCQRICSWGRRKPWGRIPTSAGWTLLLDFSLPVLYWYVSGAAPPDEGGLGNFL